MSKILGLDVKICPFWTLTETLGIERSRFLLEGFHLISSYFSTF